MADRINERKVDVKRMAITGTQVSLSRFIDTNDSLTSQSDPTTTAGMNSSCARKGAALARGG